MTLSSDELDDLAEQLTQHLGIPFRPTTRGTVVFRDRLRTTDWSVPMLFDGHAVREDDGAIVPADFVGHALWSNLKATRAPRSGRKSWTCTLRPEVAQALVDELAGDEEVYGDTRAAWSVELLLDEQDQRARHRDAA